MSFGDDDDPFAEDGPAGLLELDLPPSHTAQSSRSMPAAAPPPDREVVPPSFAASRPAVSQAPGSLSTRAAPPIGPTSASLRSAPAVSQTPAGSTPPSSVAAPAPRSADPAEMIARYPSAPAKITQAPAYAVRVFLRQLELRQDLASLRKRRSPDVGLYERALAVHDKKTFAIGMAMVVSAVAVATLLFFLPVILRFANAPD